ncbi:MAG: protein kinase [Coleofasciculaceae cyanobacterium SM2_1_6]|nr:protein kinase [Coleofasciculaceae cyanobacterium SM2_1_6]
MIPCLNPACNASNASDAKFCMKCGTKLLIQDRYRPLKALGAGAFGKAFLAVDMGKPSQPKCVIKQFIFTDGSSQVVQTAKELFYQEAQQLEKLGKHDQIPQLFGYCEQEIPKQGNGKKETVLCLIQEFVDGENLLEELNKNGSFSEAKIRQILADSLPVLEFFHSHNVIHRDIKPENIMRRRIDQKLVLIDFGVARQTSTTSLGKTDTTFAGTDGYAAPEQLNKKTIFSSDIYSLGVTCLVLLTGVDAMTLYDPYEGEFRWRHYLINNPVADSLGRVLDGMTQGAVKHRYKFAQEVLQALNPSAPKVSISIPVTPKSFYPHPQQLRLLKHLGRISLNT